MWTVRKLRSGDCAATARLLARAFADNEAYTFMHPRSATRPRDLHRFFVRNLHWHLPLALTWVVVDGADQPVGTATLEPPGGVPHTRLAVLLRWLIPTLLQQGPRGVQRLAEVGGAFAARNRASAGSDRYWHVHAVAVDPDRQRSGAGTALLNHVLSALEELRASQPGPAVLSTQRASNVLLYERHGFENLGKFRIGGAAPDAFDSWSLRRGGSVAVGGAIAEIPSPWPSSGADASRRTPIRRWSASAPPSTSTARSPATTSAGRSPTRACSAPSGS